MITTASALSVGGLTIGITVLVLNARGWWKAGKSPRDLAPFLGAFSVGALWTACAGGVLGWAGGAIAGGANMAGGEGLVRATGAPDTTVAAGAVQGLTTGGAVVVVVATIAGLAALKSAGKGPRLRMIGGLICGACLTLTAGAAGLVDATVLPAANSAGDAVLGLFGVGA